MRIGNIELKYGIALAPMAGVTDSAYRHICREHGAEYMVSEMISAKAIHFHDKKTSVLARIKDDERPMAIQLFGSEPDILAEAALVLINSSCPPDVIDINMGCPVRKIVANGEGSALMRSPDKIFNIVNKVKKAVDIPVTVKIRTGLDSEHINAAEAAKAAEAAGADAICVHGRTREQMYAPPVDMETIASVKKACKIPVFGNGDIYCAADALRMLNYTGCDGVMLARGTMGNPWLFDEIKAALDGKEYISPSDEEKLCTAEKHIKMLIEDKGSIIGVLEARKHLGYYIKGFEGASYFRGRINTASCEQEISDLINEIREKIHNS